MVTKRSINIEQATLGKSGSILFLAILLDESWASTTMAVEQGKRRRPKSSQGKS